MKKIWNVHYSDGTIKKHKNVNEDFCTPGIERVFYNSPHRCYQIVEIGEEDVWVELISEITYNLLLAKGVSNNFVHFEMLRCELINF